MKNIQNLLHSVLSVYDQNGDIVGTSFAFTKSGRVVTCAHVVIAAASNPNNTIKLGFLSSQLTATVQPEMWSPPEAFDIAGLQLDEVISDIHPVMTEIEDNSNGHQFSSYGYPKMGAIRGIWASGDIKGIVTNGKQRLIQLSSPELAAGMSGSPILDINNNTVIGMLTSVYNPDKFGKNRDTAFAIAMSDMTKIIPDIKTRLQTNIDFRNKSLSLQIQDLREMLIVNPLEGARRMRAFLDGNPGLTTRISEVDLQYSELVRLEREIKLFGESSDTIAKRSRIVYGFIEFLADIKLLMET